MLFSYPLMCGIQEISGQIGRVTGRGIAGNLRKLLPPRAAGRHRPPGAGRQRHQPGRGHRGHGRRRQDFGRRPGAALRRPVRRSLSVAMETFMPYDRYAKVLKWMCAALFAYVATVFVVHVPWGTRPARHRPALDLLEGGLHHQHRRRAGHDHQPVPVLLAGRAGGGDRARQPAQTCRSRLTPRPPRRNCTASAWTPTPAWPSPTSSPSSSS